MSSTTPTIIEHADGSFYLAIGGSGGGRIFGSVLQVMLNLDWGMDVSEAIEAGRVHDQLYPFKVDADEVVPCYLLDALKERGHNVTGMSASFRTNHFRLMYGLSVGYHPHRGRRTSGSPERWQDIW